MTVHEPSNAKAGPLTGVRVFDLSRVLVFTEYQQRIHVLV